MSAGIALFGLVADKEPGAQVLIGATTREQAGHLLRRRTQDGRRLARCSPA